VRNGCNEGYDSLVLEVPHTLHVHVYGQLQCSPPEQIFERGIMAWPTWDSC